MILSSFIIILIALAVRLPGLGTFFTADEFLWVDRSRNFLGGLLSSDFGCLLPFEDQTNQLPGQGLACTLRTGHPGVITMWTGSLGIWLQWLTTPAELRGTLLEFVQQLPTNPVDQATIAPVRLPGALLTSLFVGLFYLLLCRLFAAEIAFLTGLLIALNPFHIALSRVLHHDALSTNFIIASALSLIIYFGVERRAGWLIFSGVMAGLAMLTKLTGFFLIPYAGLLGLWSLGAHWAGKEQTDKSQKLPGGVLWRTVRAGLLWLGVAVLCYVAFWPALWVVPDQVLNTVFSIGTKYASEGHAKGVHFLGQILNDPGPLFYPVVWFFRTNFWSMLGVILAGGLAFGALKGRSGKNWLAKLTPHGFDDRAGLLLWISAFLFFFTITLMLLVDKKQDRYALPIFPMLDLVAAIGLLTLIRQALARRVLIGLILLVNLTLTLLSYPYYFSYYNPLVGGIRMAERALTVGWGEGLNLAAAHLNRMPDAGQLKVASWYGSTFAPFFQGETIRYSDQKGNTLGADYVVSSTLISFSAKFQTPKFGATLTRISDWMRSSRSMARITPGFSTGQALSIMWRINATTGLRSF